jgi:hypothetical protein
MTKEIVKKILLYAFIISTIIYLTIFIAVYHGYTAWANWSFLVDYSFLVPLFLYRKKIRLRWGFKEKGVISWDRWIIMLGIPLIVLVEPILAYYGFASLKPLLHYSWKYWLLAVLNILFFEGIIINVIVWIGIIYDNLIKFNDHVFVAAFTALGLFFWSLPFIWLKSLSLHGSIGLIYILNSFVLISFLMIWLDWLYLLVNRVLWPIILAYTFFVLVSYALWTKETVTADLLVSSLWIIIILSIYIYYGLRNLKLIRKYQNVN